MHRFTCSRAHIEKHDLKGNYTISEGDRFSELEHLLNSGETARTLSGIGGAEEHHCFCSPCTLKAGYGVPYQLQIYLEVVLLPPPGLKSTCPGSRSSNKAKQCSPELPQSMPLGPWPLCSMPLAGCSPEHPWITPTQPPASLPQMPDICSLPKGHST